MATTILKTLGRMGLCLGVIACTHPTAPARATFPVFGTLVEVQIRHAQGQRTDEAFAQLEDLFDRLHQDWHPWEPGALTELNERLATGQWVPINDDLRDLLVASQAMEELSQGHFNAGIGQLVQLWGFHTSEYPITEPPPSAAEINTLVQTAPSAWAIEIRTDEEGKTWAWSDSVSVALDFSGIGKGGAAQKACQLLRSLDLSDALVNLGGDVMVCGEATVPWRVAIKDPDGGILEVIEVTEPIAVFTSGQYYRYGDWDGTRYAHILDPRTGYPVGHIMQATAIHQDPLLADAAATALVVAGPEMTDALAKEMRLSKWIVVSDADSEASTDR